MSMKVWGSYVAVCACALLAGCSSGSGDEGDEAANGAVNNTDGKGDQAGDETLCAAVRGNGQLIPAHFGSLARIAEHYGPLDAISGGSSASITSFLAESMQMNPLLDQCRGVDCTDEQVRARLGLLYKSFQGYIEFLGQTDEAVAIQAILPLVARIKEAGLEATLAEDPEGTRDALVNLLEQDALFALLNPELIGLLQNSANPQYHVNDILAAVQGFGSFSADDPKILVRPGVLSFGAVAEKLGTAASFYAGNGAEFPETQMDAWMEACAVPGSPWSEVANLPAGDGTCRSEFFAMLGDYREAFEAPGARTRSRIEDQVGDFLPALISTSVLVDDGVAAWEESRSMYNSGVDPTLDVSFDDVRFGYFGDPDSLGALQNSTRTDLKSQKAIGLGQVSWRTALSYSPAEPGLARALPIDDAHVSAGGWSDLHPVLVLKDIGCDKVIYVTRTDPESNFAQGVASLLGMSGQDARDLYALDNPDSSFSQSLAEADAVWCTNWNDIDALQFEAVGEDGYNAVLQSTDSFFTESKSAYDNVVADSGLEGCSAPARSAD